MLCEYDWEENCALVSIVRSAREWEPLCFAREMQETQVACCISSETKVHMGWIGEFEQGDQIIIQVHIWFKRPNLL